MSFSSIAVNLTESWRWQDNTAIDLVTATASGAVSPDGSVFLAKRVTSAGGVDNDTTSSLAESGTTTTSSALSRVVVLKLDGLDGSETWALEEESSGASSSEALAVAVGADGDAIVAGTIGACEGEASSDDCAIVAFKLSGSDGEELWRYESALDAAGESSTTRAESENTDGGGGGILALSIDSEGSALFVGGASGKLDGATGESIWGAIGLEEESTELYQLHSCTVDSDDNLVAAGLAGDNTSALDVGFATKIDGNDGDTIWTWQDQTNDFDEVLLGVAVDKVGDAYVAGGEGVSYIGGVQIGNSSVVIKLDGSNGREIWRFSGGPTNGGSIFRSVAVYDANETVIAAGVTEGVWDPFEESEGQLDFLAVALNATTGEEIGHWQGGTSDQDAIGFTGFDSQGGLYLGGYSDGSWAAVSSATSSSDTSSGGVSVVKFEPPGYTYGEEEEEAEEANGEWSVTLVGLCAGLAVALLVLLFCCIIEIWRRTRPGTLKAWQDPSVGFQPSGTNDSGKSTPIRGGSNSTPSPRGNSPCPTSQSATSPGQSSSLVSSTRPDSEERQEDLGVSIRGIISSTSYTSTVDRLSRRPTVEDAPRRRHMLEFGSSLSSGFLLSPLDENPQIDVEQPRLEPQATSDNKTLVPVGLSQANLIAAASQVEAREAQPKVLDGPQRRKSPAPEDSPEAVAEKGVPAKSGTLVEIIQDLSRSRYPVCGSSLSSSSGFSSLDSSAYARFAPPKKDLSPRTYAPSHSARSTASFATEISAPATRRPSSTVSVSEGMPQESVSRTDYSEWSWYAESVCTNRSRLPSTSTYFSPRRREGSPKLPRDFAAAVVAAEEHQASGMKIPDLSSPVLGGMGDDLRLQQLARCHAMWDSDAGSTRRDTDADVASEGSDGSDSFF